MMRKFVFSPLKWGPKIKKCNPWGESKKDEAKSTKMWQMNNFRHFCSELVHSVNWRTLPHTLTNCSVVMWAVNTFKGSFSQQQICNFIKLVTHLITIFFYSNRSSRKFWTIMKIHDWIKQFLLFENNYPKFERHITLFIWFIWHGTPWFLEVKSSMLTNAVWRSK